MEISRIGSSLTIDGNIKSIRDFQEIKKVLDDIISNNSSVNLNIPNSISITSSVIGYLTKLIYKDKIHLSVKIGDVRLFNLLKELNLISLFNVTKDS